MTSRCLSGCSCCDKQDATIKLLTKRIEDLEQRLSQVDAFLNNFQDQREDNDCFHNFRDESHETHNVAMDEIHKGRNLSVLQSRKLVGIGRENNKSSKAYPKPRFPISIASNHSRKWTSLTLAGCEEAIDEENTILENKRVEFYGGTCLQVPPFDGTLKTQGLEKTKTFLSKKAKFVNSTAAQVRYAHLVSENGLAPVFRSETRIVYDCHHSAPMSGN